MGKDRSRLGLRKGRKKKNGSTFLENQKRHRAEVKKSRFTKKKRTDVEEGVEEDAGPRKAFKFQNFSEQVACSSSKSNFMAMALSIKTLFNTRWLQLTPLLSISWQVVHHHLFHQTLTIDQGLEKYLWTRIHLPVSLHRRLNTGGISI